jgi:hypothetical protein
MEEKIWTWTCRVCAVVMFANLMFFVGFDRTPTWAFILLIGLFFGPDALRGDLQLPWSTKRNAGE